MIEGLIGKKIGMTQLFSEEKGVIPVTVVKAGPCVVVQKKIKEKAPNSRFWGGVRIGNTKHRSAPLQESRI